LHHLSLHSFPTRRSSDLAPPPQPDRKNKPTNVEARTLVFTELAYATTSGWLRIDLSVRRLPVRQPTNHLLGPWLCPAAERRAGQDRKSTRLNSSHVKISY